MLRLSITIFLLAACQTADRPQGHIFRTEICGRDDGISLNREPIYRIAAPYDWERLDPSSTESTSDTTTPLCEFLIIEGADQIRIAIHNFPSDSFEGRIPPQAQIMRWQNQFDPIDSASLTITPQSFSGYSGMLIEASGLQKGKPLTLMAWALQLAPEHYRSLKDKQMRSDVTIKASGPKFLMRKYREVIFAFARSFELIEEIPTQS